MATFLSYLRLLFLSISGMLILCIVFAANTSFVNGMVMGKIFWFHNMVLLFAGSTLFMEITTMRTKNFRFILSDILILLFAAISLATYNWKLNPEPEKLLFGGQLIMLWFMLRLAIKNYQSLLMFYLSIIICTGIFEAIWGMTQLYGFSPSNHSLFKLTGTFFNPGPFSGYLAIVLPVSFGIMLRFRNCKKAQFWNPRTTLYYLSWLAIIIIIIILPAGMSRSAWIAAAISCIWVYVTYRIGWKNIHIYWKEHRKLFISFLFIGIAVISIGIFAIYSIKKDSANGRLLMWHITAKAIEQQPLKGVGIGGFPETYAQTQAEYFASGKASEIEMYVAGSPEYAFNEFLQIGLEQGIPGLIVFLAWVGCSLYYGIRSKRYGTTGGIIALMIFAFSSYPFQLPSFWVLLIFLSVICVSTNKVKESHSIRNKCKLPCIGLITTLGCGLLFLAERHMPETYNQWTIAKALYNNKGYEAAIDSYVMLYPQLKHKHDYLFEYAQCLSKTGQYAKANLLLQRATHLSSDPMLYYMMAKNEQSLGQYDEAEKHLLYAINILPERIYPYYLLTKLYADPNYKNPEKMKVAANIVLNKKPKVENTAIKEMRAEIKKLLEEQ
ncbi:O-antigen ligase family protein [Parabacteroides bouchesdurhonensis]|uniref:O-antigen ligase family protein n=1 Tax=Parabacteroides bouchesdurhonensis TaxID=1936995 RepID=UPI001F407C2F|nr:O-antigen ligase family protein [Parabacteroides bouchesdurhonensis]